MPDENVQMPMINLETLKPYISLVAVDSVGLFREAARSASSGEEIISLLTQSLLDAVGGAIDTANRMQPETPLEEQVEITEAMTQHVRTVIAAGLSLLPLYQATAQVIEAARPRIHTVN